MMKQKNIKKNKKNKINPSEPSNPGLISHTRNSLNSRLGLNQEGPHAKNLMLGDEIA